MKKLVDDVGAFKPSLFVAVPRVLDRMKSGIEAKVARSGPIASTIFKLAVWYKRIWISLGFLNNVSFLKRMALQLRFRPVPLELPLHSPCEMCCWGPGGSPGGSELLCIG